MEKYLCQKIHTHARSQDTPIYIYLYVLTHTHTYAEGMHIYMYIPTKHCFNFVCISINKVYKEATCILAMLFALSSVSVVCRNELHNYSVKYYKVK